MAPKKRDLPYLTRAESELMRAFWEHGPQTVTELLGHLGRDVAYTTALTLVRILEKKGYVTHEAQPDGGRAYVYRPKVQRENVTRRHVRDLVDRLFGGSAQSLVVGLLDDEDLSPEELAELRAQIDKKLSGNRGGKR